MESRKFFSCACFYVRNIFLKQLNCHVEYWDRSQFIRSYSQFLYKNGYKEEEQIDSLISEIEAEIDRRKNREYESIKRQELISQIYKPLYPQLTQLQESFLSPEFLAIVNYCKQEDATFEGLFDFIQETQVPRTYSFPVFTAEFCEMFLAEMHNFNQSDAPKERPNSMNRYGVLVHELGFQPFFTSLRENYFNPISQILFPDWGGGTLDSHKVFTVQYEPSKDPDLSFHFDNAEVTVNVALSPKESYKGGNLYFGAMRTEVDKESDRTQYIHEPTIGVIHRGQHKHGASPVTDGQRCNLIIWMRSSAIRNQKCPMCDQEPQLQKSLGFGDGFTRAETVDVCSVI
ncbi:2-oxoglutarate and iron-dependent oxygenase domain-containing protein 2 [Mactra antiquata]